MACMSLGCGEKSWAQHIGGKDYYREESSLRGIPCPNPEAYQRAELFDAQVATIIGGLRLPRSWRELVREFLNSEAERERAIKDLRRLEEKLRRIKFQFREGDIDQKEYEQEMALTKAALAAVQEPDDTQLVQLGDHVEGLVEAWHRATKEERHQLLTMMLDAVYVDVNAGLVVGLKPKPAFLPLFNLKEPIRAREVLLVTGDPERI